MKNTLEIQPGRWAQRVRLGSKLNYLKSFLTYKTRVETDSGTVNDETLTKDIYKDLPAQDSIEFAWIGGAGSKKRTSTIYSFFTKLYSLVGTNDATQTTASSQPYVSGNIAPNEVEALKNPNGDSRYFTHPEISFSSTDEWSVTTLFNWAGNNGTYDYLYGDVSTTRIKIKEGTNSLKFNNTTILNSSEFLGKNKIIQIISNGLGSIQFWINGILISTRSITADVNFDIFLAASTAISYSTISSHIIRSQALTPEQVSAEHDLLRSIYPEIPSIVIGTEDIATSSLEMVDSTNGTVITQAADNADWATGAARWCYHNADSAAGAIYGKLYNKAARDVIIANPPSGWHVATEAELTALALNGGNALKVGGTDYWNTTGGTNSTGFTALGSSSRNADGTFNAIKDHAGFWCADSDKVLKVYHNNDTAEVIAVTSVNEGFSIRLIKDSV